MKIIINHFYLLLFSIFISCTNAQNLDIVDENSIGQDTLIDINTNQEIEGYYAIDSVKTGLTFLSLGNYDQIKENIKSLRIKLAQEYSLINDSLSKIQFIDSISPIFTEKLLNEIVPHWYGTVWDFNGYTSKPNEGTIACGYFVSTTLKDVGLKLNRYKLAQQGPKNEASTIVIDKSELKSVRENDIHVYIDDLNDGLYFVGLDNHVGYLYIKDNESFFLHSNYIDGYVMIEKTSSSNAFNSGIYYISPISRNRLLIKKWLLNEELLVIID